MRLLKRFCIFFALGGLGYAVIELLFRGYTHPTMVLAGGICFTLMSVIAEVFLERHLLFKAFLSALSITAVELIFGIIFNLSLGMNVWDYSQQPFNLLGQICPVFTLAWFVLSFLMLPFATLINSKLKNVKKQ